MQTFVDALAGTGKPFLLAVRRRRVPLGRPVVETDRTGFRGPDAPRGGTREPRARRASADGVHAVSLRFAPTVHGAGDHGFIAADRRRGPRAAASPATSATARNRWAAVHRSDAGTAVALGLEKAAAGTALHVVAEQGVPTREIAEAIGRGLGLPATSSIPPTRRSTSASSARSSAWT